MKTTYKLFITALLAAGSLLTSAVAAPLTLDVAADNWVSGTDGFQDKHYGGWDQISVHNEGAGTLEKERIGFFRFDLSSYTGGTISGAELEWVVNDTWNGTPEFTIYGISDGGASENFEEGATTDPAGTLQSWNNSGYTYSSGQSLSDSASFGDLVDLGSMTVTNNSVGSTATFSSAALDTFLNNDGNDIATFLVDHTNGSGNVGGFRSKEHSSGGGATLTVIPEPSSVVLVAMGFIAVLGFARKRRG
ncbi:MAG: PEP-CTERM sorting domain-containing protein [Kiritimatiellia bacterium]